MFVIEARRQRSFRDPGTHAFRGERGAGRIDRHCVSTRCKCHFSRVSHGDRDRHVHGDSDRNHNGPNGYAHTARAGSPASRLDTHRCAHIGAPSTSGGGRRLCGG